MLIESHRHRKEDLAHWRILSASDSLRGRLSALDRKVARSHEALRKFSESGPFYLSVSWGKESVVAAHLVAAMKLSIPVRWFPAGDVENPDCALVRDEFLRRFDIDYHEHPATELEWSRDGFYLVHDGAQSHFAKVSKAFGVRYASGIRAEESRARRLRLAHWGENTINTCAPIGWWSLDDVYAYLARYDLPIHPVYACTWGGRYPRERLRVSTIGGVNGGDQGRREWEAYYYPETVRTVRQLAESACPTI